MKKGYIYCYVPICEVKLYCIDIAYSYKDILNTNRDIIFIKKIYNPNIIKKKFYKKFNKFLLINNIFSGTIKLKKIKDFFKII